MIFFIYLNLCEAAIFGYYNVYIPGENKEHALRIVDEQLNELRKSQLLKSSESLFVNVISPLPRNEFNMQLEDSNIVVNYAREGGEEITLNQIVANCAGKADLLYYIHSKGSFTQSQENTIMRRALMTAVVTNWPQCVAAITNDNCDVCGLRFSPFPHAHFAGNFWWSHCEHIARLVPTNAFAEFLPIDAPDCRDYSCGRRRCGYEHWVASHPLTRAVDCLSNHQYIHSYEYLDGMNEFKCMAAPRSHLSPHVIKQNLLHRFFHNYASGAESCQHTIAEYALVYPNVSLTEIAANTLGSWMQMCSRMY